MADKPSDKLNKLGPDFLQDVWGKREEGMPVPRMNWTGPVRQQDILYLLKRYPFLQIANTDADLTREIQVNLLTSQSGWIIQDYGDVMSSSPGKNLFGDYNEEGEGGEGGGTIINQAFLTAQEMVAIAMTKGWSGIEIIAGTSIMQWAAWMTAEDSQFPLIGYEPSKEDRAKRERIKKELPSADISEVLGFRKR